MVKAHFLKTCLVAALFSLIGCSPFMKYKYGISKPKTESPGSLLTFLEKNEYPVENQYIFKDSGAYVHMIRQPDFRSHLLSYMIFNKQGHLLEKDSAKCQWAGADMVMALHPDSSFRHSGADELSEIINAIQPIGICSCQSGADPVPDYTLVITWGKFLGKYNYRLFDLEKAVNANPVSNIRTIWLNIDMQKSWKLNGYKGLELK
jgi:hypothetical protein